MKRALLAMLAVTLVASSTGCCCFDKLFCWGCHGGCGGCGGCGGGWYGNEGPGCGGGCGGCSSCGGMAGGMGPGFVGRGGPGPGYAGRGHGGAVYDAPGAYGGSAQGGPYPPRAAVGRRPAAGHPLVHQRRDADGEYEFAAGPPTGGTTYPYYTTRGPRDFLARNPRDIGP
jgi:hypothetical protein